MSVVFPLCHSILFLHKKNLMFLQHKRKSAAVHSDKNKTFSSYEKKCARKSGFEPLYLKDSGSNPKKLLKIRSQLHHLCVLKSQVRILDKSFLTFKWQLTQILSLRFESHKSWKRHFSHHLHPLCTLIEKIFTLRFQVQIPQKVENVTFWSYFQPLCNFKKSLNFTTDICNLKPL